MDNLENMFVEMPLLYLPLLMAMFAFFIWAYKDKKRREKLEDERRTRQKQRKKNKTKVANEVKIKKIDTLNLQLRDIQKISIPNISDFKKILIQNENAITKKGGDNQLFAFMKIDSFLCDFRTKIEDDQKNLNDLLDVNFLKSRVKEESKRDPLEKLAENLEDSVSALEGGKKRGFDANLDELFDLGKIVKPVMEHQIKTMEFYRNIAITMIVFYLDDKKIRYFEIYEAFEKLGVFDSTWQKGVMNKLDNIEIRLAQMNNQLTELNQNFISLLESSENIVSDLKEINSSIMTNNMLQAITAYQTWRINKNTKSLKE